MSPGAHLTHNSYENAALIATAFEHGIYGIALWDEEFNLITANRQYADLHKIPNTFLTPGTSLLAVTQNLKDRGVLTEDTDPEKLKDHIARTLAATGQLTASIKLTDGTFLETSAERLSNGCTVAYLRNATRERIFAKKAYKREKRIEAYADAIAKFPVAFEDKITASRSALINQITQTVATLLSVDWCIVWTRSETLNEATAASTYQNSTQSHIEIDDMILADRGDYLAVLETSQVIAIDDLEYAFGPAKGDGAPLDEHAHASLDVPFRKNGRIMGVLSCLDTQSTRSWGAEDKILASAAASHIGSLMSSSEPTEL